MPSCAGLFSVGARTGDGPDFPTAGKAQRGEAGVKGGARGGHGPAARPEGPSSLANDLEEEAKARDRRRIRSTNVAERGVEQIDGGGCVGCASHHPLQRGRHGIAARLGIARAIAGRRRGIDGGRHGAVMGGAAAMGGEEGPLWRQAPEAAKHIPLSMLLPDPAVIGAPLKKCS